MQSRREYLKPRRSQKARKVLAGAAHACAASTHPAYSLNNSFSSPSAPLREKIILGAPQDTAGKTVYRILLPPGSAGGPSAFLTTNDTKTPKRISLRLCERQFSLFPLTPEYFPNLGPRAACTHFIVVHIPLHKILHFFLSAPPRLRER